MMGVDFNTTQSALQSHSFTRDSRAGTEPATFQSEIDLPTSDFKFICMTCPGWFFYFLQQKSKKSHPITNSKRVASLCYGLYKNCLHYINKWTISQNVFPLIISSVTLNSCSVDVCCSVSVGYFSTKTCDIC